PLWQNTAAANRQRTQPNHLRLAVDALELARREDKTAIPGLRDVVGLLLRNIACACSNGVQHRLPNVRQLPVDERYGNRDLARGSWKFARNLKPGDSATDNHYAVGNCRLASCSVRLPIVR